MRRPVAFSTVLTSSSGPPPSAPPPRPYAELILWRPWPGMSTIESRGRLTRVVGPLPVCSSMIVSVSSDSGSPVAYSARCSGVRFALLSEPTISQLVPAEDASLSEGSADTLARVLSTYTAKPTATTSSTSSIAPRRRPQLGRGRGRTGRGRDGRRGGAPAPPCGPLRRWAGSNAVRCSGRGRRGGGGGGAG